MDSLDVFAIFVRIVEEGSLAPRRARLRRSPPAVTRALAALEGRVGVRLSSARRGASRQPRPAALARSGARGYPRRLRGADARARARRRCAAYCG